MTTVQRLRQHAISSGAPRALVTRADGLLEDLIRVIHHIRNVAIESSNEVPFVPATEGSVFDARCAEACNESLHGRSHGQDE